MHGRHRHGGSNTREQPGAAGYPGGGTGTTTGHWAVSYSSQGTSSWDYPGQRRAFRQSSLVATDSSASVGSNSYLDAATTGTISATLTWVPTTGQDSTSDPPASSVIVTETGYAAASGGGVGTASADDGWGDTSGGGGYPADASGGGGYPGASSSASSSGTHYEVEDGSSGTITVGPFTLSAATPDNTTPDANGNFLMGGAGVFVSLNFAGSSVTITPGGAIPSGGKYHILVGQKCSPTLNLPSGPSGFTAISYEWSVDGNTVQSWDISPDNRSAKVHYGIGDAGQASPSWYWSDTAQVESIFCKVSIKPNTGTAPAQTINTRRDVTLDVPTYSNNDISGDVKLDTSGPNTGTLSVYAGPGSQSPLNCGMWFADSVQTPSLYGSGGTWYRIQLASVSRYETPKSGATPIPAQGNGVTGALDFNRDNTGTVTYVYGSSHAADGQVGTAPDTDSPWVGPLIDDFQEYAVQNENFQDYIMYTPPGDSIAVPLVYFTWSWNVDVHIPPAPKPTSWFNWISQKDTSPHGTVTPPGGTQRMYIYPTWSSLANIAWASH